MVRVLKVIVGTNLRGTQDTDSKQGKIKAMREKSDLVKEFREMEKGKMPFLEFAVKSKETGEDVCIACHLEIDDNRIYLHRDAVTTEEEKSDLIAGCSIPLNPIYSLEDHLFELYYVVCNDIMHGDLYELI